MNCICQNAPQRPGVTEVLDSLEQHTVCTDTACYEGEEAAFGVTAGQSAAPSNQNMFFMFMTCAPPSPLPPSLPAAHTRAPSPCARCIEGEGAGCAPTRRVRRGARAAARAIHPGSHPASPPAAPRPSLRFMMFVAMMLRMQRPSPQLTSKAGSSSSHANQPPPGPPPPPPAPEVD